MKLCYLDGWIEARRRKAENYAALLSQSGLEDRIKLPKVLQTVYHTYNQFTIRSAERDLLRAHLASRGVPTEIYYPSPLHLQPAFAFLGYKPGDYPEAERACAEVLSLPIYPELNSEQQAKVVHGITEFYSR